MKVLILNGSPRGERSNTLIVTKAFLEGMLGSGKELETEFVTVTKYHIDHCKGCFCCWQNTPGECIIKDDMKELLQKYIQADYIIWSFPLYYYGMPSLLKAFMDRLLPINLPYIGEKEDGTNFHPSRYDLTTQQHILISTCGFCSVENNYEALLKQFDILTKGNYVKILCPEGELLQVPQLKPRKDSYLTSVRAAGEELLKHQCILPETKGELEALLVPAKQFIEMANTSWKAI